MFGERGGGPQAAVPGAVGGGAAADRGRLAARRGIRRTYTLFLTGQVARPIWPAGAITAGEVRALQAAHAGFAAIARDLRRVDVHPPLYFWTMAAWRRLVGDSLFAARLASVLFSAVTLGLIAATARAAAIPASAAVLLTVGCYGFAYTGAVARGFALAQMLSVAGIAVLLAARRRPSRMLAAGVLLGAATFANYLAAFVACAALLHTVIARSRATKQSPRTSATPLGLPGRVKSLDRLRLLATIADPIVIGFAVWLPADLWFFLAQRQSRIAQFAPFEPVSASVRLARYSVASVFGGLPLYVDGIGRTAVSVAISLLAVAAAAIAIRRRQRVAAPTRLLLAMAAVAPPIGLLLLGVVFDNTPIELRYLAFAAPFIGLLLAGTLPRGVRYAVLAVQAIALLGLMTRPETMQPARATAVAAAALVGDGVVMLPRGNDGVGTIGAFAIESPAAVRLLVIGPDTTAAEIRAQASGYPRVVLALLGQDATSRAVLPVMRQAFADPCWHAAGEAFNVQAFDRTRAEGCACSSQASR
jgi:uncharacterized membrane protein